MKMSYGEMPPFCHMVRSSGLGEVWTHTHDQLKFTQFGWRCTNKENSYSKDTLVGNWNEQRFDLEKQKNAKPLPSQVKLLPSQVKPLPSQVKPLPSQVRPLPFQVNPLPSQVKPLPSQVKPLPSQIKPLP